jgi:pimeloyl-ACP methyl ester carboxylesterase
VGEDSVDARALILVDIVPHTESAGVARIRNFMQQKPEGFASLDEVAEAITQYRPQQTRPRSLDGLAKNVRLGKDGKFRWHWDPRFIGHHHDRNDRHARMSACARRLTLPTLLVRGGNSDVVSEAGVEEFLGLCPRAEYVNMLEAGHMVAGDRNDAFGRAAIDFLLRHARTGGMSAGSPVRSEQ